MYWVPILLFYDKDTNLRLAENLRLYKFHFPSFSIFISCGYFQHSGAGSDGSSCFINLLYIIPKKHPVIDAVEFSYGASLSHMEDCGGISKIMGKM